MHDPLAVERPRILLVEDETAVREHLAGVLSDEYVVATAGNGREALAAILKAAPALIVTDIVMPDVDGIELLKILRSTPATDTIPVLLVSGKTLDEWRIEGFQQGADGYLTKPYTERELRAYIGSMLRAARRRSAAAREEAERQALRERTALLESMTEQLKEADRRKTEFLAVLAHELRNPLAPLRNGLNILKLRGAADPALSLQTVDMMDRQMAHLVRLVDDLLDVSRITRGRLELRRQTVLLTDVVARAVEAAASAIESQQHEFVLDVRAKDLLIDGDPDRLAQVFSNLLLNGAKYTPRGGRIALTLTREAHAAVITVQDNGMGIAASALEHIFEMFSQARAAAMQATEGLGIGLSLVRTLVQMHGGTVAAFSEGPGKGSTFTVRLPVVTGKVPEPREPERAGSLPHRQRILVVDDNADAAGTLAMLLKMQGHDLRTAGDGEEALEQARTFEPDIIFMDLGMPRLDGIEAARRIRALPQCRDVRIVALTGWGQDADRRRTREAGMDHHLTKPVSLEALQRLLGALERA
jgi:signal transduction histidine kinase